MTGAPAWAVADDAEEVHALLCACDARQASRSAPAPVRNRDTTRQRVADGAVQVLRDASGALASFTLTWTAPFDEPAGATRPALRPAYLSRLAVRPDMLDAGRLLGPQCYRRAVALARARGADVVRLEANPDLDRVVELVRLMGFVQVGPIRSDGVRRRAMFEKRLDR